MKKILYITIGLMTFSTINVSAQNWKDIRKKAKTAAKTNASGINPKGALSQDEVGKGLKEALNQGIITQKGAFYSSDLLPDQKSIQGWANVRDYFKLDQSAFEVIKSALQG